MSLAANPVYHARTKHIKIDVHVHLVRDMVMQKLVDILYVPTHEQIADVLNKRVICGEVSQVQRQAQGGELYLSLKWEC